MSNVFIICRAKRNGNSSWQLEQALREAGVEAYRVTPMRTPYRNLGWASTFINYGCSTVPEWWDRVPVVDKLLNPFESVRASANKVLMQEAFQRAGVPCLESTTDFSVAEAWADDTEDSIVVCRRLTRASRGRGIVLAHNIEELVPAGLYTKLFTGNRVREYRVYIVNGKAVDLTEKRRRTSEWHEANGVDRNNEYNRLIRTNSNGWVFARNTIEASPLEQDEIKYEAEHAARAVGIGFGAVDMIVDRSQQDGELNRIYAVETNTSVGIHRAPTTARILAEAIAEERR